MKLILFFLIYLITIGLIFKPVKKTYSYLFFFWVVILLSLCYTIQSGELDPESDLERYKNLFEADVFFWNPNFLREIMFWGFARSLYSIFQNIDLTFISINLFYSILILKGFNNYKKTNNSYLLFGFLLFYPFLTGMHVIYRQLISMAILFYSMSCLYNNKNKLGIFAFFVSGFFHNVSFIFFPLIFFATRKIYNRVLMFLALISLPSLMILSEFSSNEFLFRQQIYYLPTLSIAYMLIFFILIFIISIINIYNKVEFDYFNKLVIILSIIFISSFISLKSNLSVERIGLYCMGLIYFYLGFYIDKFKGKIYVKLIFFHISLIPILTFYSHYLI